jgi:fluoroquinolone transport system ATP-binding protein
MIEVDDLSYAYPRVTVAAVDSISFRVGRGEIFGFLGPSGAGKSTTQKILIGLLRDYRGRVTVDGREPRSWRPADYERIGVSFELPNHYLRLTAAENLRYFAALYGAPAAGVAGVLDEVGLLEDAEKRVAEYSKGMRNRLNLARALIHRPPLLFLDEPTSGLDPATSSRVRDVIRRRRGDGATVFLTTHDMRTADELCDRVAFLAEGRIRAIDSPRQLRLRHGRRVVRVETRRGAREFPLEGIADNAEFLAALRDGVETIHTQETTLDEIFIAVTGRGLP